MDYLYKLQFTSIRGVFTLSREKIFEAKRGSVTLDECCTQEEFDLFILYVQSRFNKKFSFESGKFVVKVTNAQMVEAYRTFRMFMQLLNASDIKINK